MERRSTGLLQPGFQLAIRSNVRTRRDLFAANAVEGGLAHDLAHHLHASDCGLFVELGLQVVRLNLWWVARIGRAERDRSAALRIDRSDADRHAVIVLDP